MPTSRKPFVPQRAPGIAKPATQPILRSILRDTSQNASAFLHTLLAYIRLVRLSNSLAASALVLVGAHLTLPGHASPWEMLPATAWQAALAMWCVTAFGYVSNDLHDVAEDAVNKPGRPLPQGIISRPAAMRFATLLALGALWYSHSLGLRAIAAALLVMTLLTLYNTHLKSTSGGGNLLIGALAGCTLFVGGVAVTGTPSATIRPLLAPSSMIAAFVTTREVLKTMEDVNGDRAVGKQTVAMRWGLQSAANTVGALALFTVVLTVLPLWWAGYSLSYWIWLGCGVSLPLLYTAWRMQSQATEREATRCLALLKASYVAGVVALWVA